MQRAVVIDQSWRKITPETSRIGVPHQQYRIRQHFRHRVRASTRIYMVPPPALAMNFLAEATSAELMGAAPYL